MLIDNNQKKKTWEVRMSFKATFKYSLLGCFRMYVNEIYSLMKTGKWYLPNEQLAHSNPKNK